MDEEKVEGLINELIKEMLDPGTDASERRNAAFELAMLGPKAKAAEPALLQAMSLEVKGLRAAALYALAAIGPSPACLPALMTALGDRNALRRCSAARALGTMKALAKDALPALRRLLNDEAVVRETAKHSIKQIEQT